MLVAVGSNNKVKIEATAQAFSQFYGSVEIVSAPASSGVKPFPTSERETLEGAINRAKEARSLRPDAEFAVGIEAGIVEMLERSFVRTYAVVLRDDEMGLGSSAAYEAPAGILDRLDPETENSKQIIDSMMGEQDVLSNRGVIGVLTGNRLDRTKINRDAVICALTCFVSPRYYRNC